jgi:hypothetical protein
MKTKEKSKCIIYNVKTVTCACGKTFKLGDNVFQTHKIQCDDYIRRQHIEQYAAEELTISFQLLKKDKIIEKKDKMIEKKDKMIEKKDKMIEKLLKKLSEKDEMIERKDEMIERKDEMIERKDEMIERKDEMINDILNKEEKQKNESTPQTDQNKRLINQNQEEIAENKPKITFEKCIETIKLSKTDYDYISEHGYIKGYCDLSVRVLNKYGKIAYSDKDNTYLYLNPTDQWVYFTENHAKTLYFKIQQKLIMIGASIPDIDNPMHLKTRKIIYGCNGEYSDIYTKIKQAIYNNTLVRTETLLRHIW